MKRDYRLPPGFPAPPCPWPATGRGDIAVVVPSVDRTLSGDAALSLASLRRYAGAIDHYLVVPQSHDLAFPHDDFSVIRLPDAAMAGIAAYNRLMLTPWFYELFKGYRHILIFQTDCLLLRGDLAAWASQGWSYVGAPWFARRNSRKLKGVGNGGFSLRSPADAIGVLTAERFLWWPRYAQQRRHFSSLKHLAVLWRTLREARRDKADLPLAGRFAMRFPRPEDEFWGLYAPFFSEDFTLPPPERALDFAFESRPADALALNGGRLPLGCHAFAKIDRDFWLSQLPDW